MAVSSKLRILLIEDVVEVRKTLKDMLKKMGFKNIQDTGEPEHGVKLVQEHNESGEHFELILSNYNMPEMNGIELYDKIKEIPGLKQPKFILLTSTAEPTLIKTAVGKGIKNILVKPFSQQQLVEKLINMFEKKAA